MEGFTSFDRRFGICSLLDEFEIEVKKLNSKEYRHDSLGETLLSDAESIQSSDLSLELKRLKRENEQLQERYYRRKLNNTQADTIALPSLPAALPDLEPPVEPDVKHSSGELLLYGGGATMSGIDPKHHPPGLSRTADGSYKVERLNLININELDIRDTDRILGIGNFGNTLACLIYVLKPF